MNSIYRLAIILSVITSLTACQTLSNFSTEEKNKNAGTKSIPIVFSKGVTAEEQAELTPLLNTDTPLNTNATYSAASGKSCAWLHAKLSNRTFIACRKDRNNAWQVSPALFEKEAISGETQ